jgi:hypothetical protein
MTKETLKEDVLQWTVDHFVKYGDNDIFPPLLELQFFKDKREKVAQELGQIDLYSHRPISLVESLVPKSKYGFRAGHQIYPTDGVLFTAATLTVARSVEQRRHQSAFSYRFDPKTDGDLFSTDHRYRNWLRYQQGQILFDADVTEVVSTDIADFYGRIYHHRLENCLNDYAGRSAVTNYIVTCLRDWRSRQSFGIPVGGNAARILAEALLVDVDNALSSHGWDHTRYVDDIRIFVRKGQDPYAGLAFLAERLNASEGLSLNTQKTTIWSRDTYSERLRQYVGETSDEASEAATEQLFWDAYGDQEPDPETLNELKARDLIGELEAEREKDHWDVGRIKVLLHAIRFTKPSAAGDYIKSRILDLLPFAKEVALLMQELAKSKEASFNDLSATVLGGLKDARAEHLPWVRAWLWFLLVHDVVPITLEQLNSTRGLDHTFDRRAEYILRMKLRDLTFFRDQKNRVDELSPWLQPALLYASQCLPFDEYKVWLGNVRGRLRFPLSSLFCEWCLDCANSNRSSPF